MLRRRLYYALKPFVPWRVRIPIRRYFARKKRERLKHIWPISESSATPPLNWSGWPENKQFGFLLSHDVEGQKGLDRVKQLAELEMEYGFRSSFNFIPEGDYKVPKSLITWLKDNGFEVGVHDLHHDGKLFNSKKSFAKSAIRINEYLKDWGAVGYRSGFMLRNLNWFHDLNILYDASTFDTDPFEPQPDGANTIFPFWVPRPEAVEDRKTEGGGQKAESGERRTEDGKQSTIDNSQSPALSTVEGAISNQQSSPQPSALNLQPSRHGYVELPYTLPQDSTLFLLFKEKGIDIWKRKLDWIAQKGGMAFLNVHPDYLHFEKGKALAGTFPARFYADLLKYAKDAYAEKYWQPLPKVLAQRYKTTRFTTTMNAPIPAEENTSRSQIENARPLKREVPLEIATTSVQKDAEATYSDGSLAGKRALVIVLSQYPQDPRVRRATEAMVKEGMRPEVFCLKSKPEDSVRETFNDVDIFRVPFTHKRGGKLHYLFHYARFILLAFLFVSFRSLTRRYALIHVHNMPDVLVYSALLPRMLGTKVILDLHDPMPELMQTIFGMNEKSKGVKLLKILERLSIAFSNKVITVNKTCQKMFAKRSCSIEKVHVVMNSPDEKIFSPGCPSEIKPHDSGQLFSVMYHGSLVERNGLQLAAEAIGRLRDEHANVELNIYGASTPYLENVLKWAKDQGLEKCIHYHGPKNLENIVLAIDDCDIGIIPNYKNIFTLINTPTRIFEYLARCKTVIAPSSPGVLEYFNEDQLITFKLGDLDDLTEKLRFSIDNPEKVVSITRCGMDVCKQHLWNEERRSFIKVITDLING